ncbi:MAG TPA: hypothetical protein PJ991_07205, partial [Kiritimatiellia bacterium]|nr:hypothetical protein [Kiritimatiellia bacterium]
MVYLIWVLVSFLTVQASLAGYTNNWDATSNKTAYTSGNLTVERITWNLIEALATTGDSGDWFNGTRSARGRGYGVSEITMIQNKADGLGYVVFDHRRYGTDAQVNWVAEYSTNSGSSWTLIGSAFTPGASVARFSNDVNVAGNVRIRIRTESSSGTVNRRANFDDIILSDYVVVVEPSVSTTAGTATNTTTATVGGNVTADGGASVTNRGVVFKTSPGVAISDNKTQSGSGNGTFSANLSSLAINTRYYYRAYAQNSVGTALGGELDFWTSANTPGQPTVDNPTSSSLDVTIAVAGNPSGTEFAIQVGGSNYVQADGSVGASAVWQAASAWGTVTVNGLTPSTMYSFAVKARNGADVETAFGSGQSGTTSAGATTPTVSTTIATITNIVTATAGGNVTADGSASVTNRGIIWSVASTPVVPGSQTTNGSGTGAYTSILTNLMAGQTYYYRAFAQNSIGTGYGPEYTLTTLCFDSTVTGLMVSATNNTGFTAEWSALDGAAGYWLDVSTSGTFSIAGDAPAIYTNTFEGVSKGAYASNTLTINGVVWWMHDALIGNLASDRKNGANAARIQNSGAIGMQSSTNMGLSSITFLHGVYGSDGNSDARVEYTSNGWASWSTAGTFTASSTSLTAFEATNINVSGNVAIRIIKTSGGGARLNIDDIRLYGYNTAPDYVAGYSNLFVAGTDQVVTGLNQNTIYYFRLRGAGEDGCVSFNSATQNITTTGTDTTGPTVTNLLVNGGVSLVDSAFSGGVVMTVELRDTGSGLSAGNPAGYVIYYPDGSTESGDFSAGYDEGVTDTVVVTNATALNFANWIPGVYTVMVTAVDVADNQTSNVPFTFSLTDDDVVPPQFYGKSIDGIGGTGDTNLLAGAVAIIGVNGAGVGGDDQGFSFVVLSPFPAGTRFDFVDCGWDTNALGGLGDWYNLNEFHTNTWIATGNADVGQVFRLRLDNINTPGDQVAIYQYDGALSPTNDSANVRFIYAVNLGAGWFDTLIYPGTGTNNQNSTIYRGLTNGQTAVSVPLTSGVANARYIGPTTGTASYLLSQISDSNNWASFSSGFIDLTNFSFSVTGPGDFSWDIPVLTDAQILQGGYMITNIAQDIDSGLLASNTAFGHAPYFVLFGANSNVIVSNQFSTSFSNGSTAVEAMVMSAPAGNYNYIHLGNYNAEIAVADADNDRNNDSLTAKFTMPVVVVDDDEIPPRVGDALVTVMMGGTALVPSVDFTLLAGWNFNQTNTVVSHGVGSFEHNFSSLGNSAGNILNAYLSDVDGRDLTLSGAANVGRYIQFQIDMTGREGLEVSFAARRSDTGYNSNIVSYSVNGGAFEVITQNWTPTNLAANGFGLHVFDLSGATEINNATSVIFRITFGVDGATGGGNNRFDNFQFNAEWMNHYEITDAQLAAVDSGMPLTFSFNAYDTESGIARSISGGPRDMRVTIDGLATNNFTNYVASLSSISTTSTTSTSAWSFLSFTYNQIGNLFASGASNRPVRATFADADDDRPFDELWVSNALFGTFRVIDDDTDPPLLANVNMPNAAARPFVVVTNGIAPMNSEVVRGGQLRRSGTGTNTVFKISDAELAAAGDIGLQFVFGARDVYSGVSRGAAGPGTNDVMSFSIGSLVTGNFADYNAGLSTVQTTTNQLLTNFWAFSNSSFNGSLIESLINAGQQIVRVTIPDSDNDRPNDRALLVSQQVGIIQVIDDDIRGPVISVVELPEIPGGSTILYSSFETGEGWPSFQGSGSVWTNNITSGSATGLWYGTGYINTGEPFDGVRKAGFTVDGVGQYFQLPPRDDVGQLGLVARLSGGETNRYLTAQRWNGSGWDNLGSNLVSSVEYAYMSWDVNVVGASTLRILRTGENGTPGIYIDSVTLTELTDWTSTTQVLVAWAEAVDDYSGVDEYRVVAPAVGAAIPVATNSGQGLGAAITSHTFNITGQQGVITGFVFAIDNDNDRPNDR